jgi:hypothetical protein
MEKWTDDDFLRFDIDRIVEMQTSGISPPVARIEQVGPAHYCRVRGRALEAMPLAVHETGLSARP